MLEHLGRSKRTARWAPYVVLAALLATLLPGSSILAGATVKPSVTAIADCSVQALPTLGGRYGHVVAVNRRGLAVGVADDADGVAQPVLWPRGAPRRLVTGLSSSVPLAVNAVGQVAGMGVAASDSPVGWTWAEGRSTRLKVREDRVASPASINDHGVIVGALSPDEGTAAEASSGGGEDENDWAAVWASPSSQPELLHPLGGDQGAHAFAVDGRGRAAGVSQGEKFTPVIWDASGRPHALPTLGGDYGIVRALSDSGVAVGDALRADGADRPVMWDAAGRIVDLGLPSGARAARAEAILRNGVVVGTAEMPAPGGGWRTQGVRWIAPGAVQLLPSAVGSVADADGFTTVGGYRSDGTGGRHPTLWQCGR